MTKMINYGYDWYQDLLESIMYCFNYLNAIRKQDLVKVLRLYYLYLRLENYPLLGSDDIDAKLSGEKKKSIRVPCKEKQKKIPRHTS